MIIDVEKKGGGDTGKRRTFGADDHPRRVVSVALHTREFHVKLVYSTSSPLTCLGVGRREALFVSSISHLAMSTQASRAALRSIEAAW